MHTILRWIDSIQTIKEESGKEMKPLIKLAAKKEKNTTSHQISQTKSKTTHQVSCRKIKIIH